jgi:DNA-binding SARP family transcriptional activator
VGRRAPQEALTTLQTYILQLRKALAAATGGTLAEVAANLLQTRSNGYRFVTEPGELDLHKYRELERSATRALGEGDLRSASRNFRQALDLWTEPTLVDVEQGRLLEAEVARLERSRLTMLEHRIELDLRLGLHREILSELAALVAQQRFHEDLHAQYILALYRSGCRTRALEVFHQLRRCMVDELGLEPSPKLQRLVQAVLISDPVLDTAPVVPLPRFGESPKVPA